MQIFVTGASGFVGGAFTRGAVLAGHSVRAMARSEKSAAAVRALLATPVNCALGAVKPEDLAGCDAIVHSAAFVEQWGTRAEFYAANVDGTVQLLDAAQKAGVRRFIHISTESVSFYGQDMHEIDETYPYAEKTPFLYSETKAESERRVLSANRDGFTTIALRPRLIWGPGDNTLLPGTLEIVEKGAFMWINGGRHRTSTMYIENLVDAILLSLTRGRGGEAYFVTDGKDVTMREFLTAYVKTQKKTLGNLSVPRWLAEGLGTVLEGVWKTLGLKGAPPLTRLAIALAACECTVRIDKIRRDMDYKPRFTLEQGMAKMTATEGKT